MEINLNKIPIIFPTEAKEKVPSKKGIYFWFNHKTNKLVYIGIGTGIGGLKKRIVLQHLNPKYLEFRSKVHNKVKDEFQLNCAVTRISKKNKTIEKGIDKSAFRKSIGRTLKLRPGEDTVKYIFENLYFKIYLSNNIDYLKEIEKKLIKIYQPKFNTTHK